MKTLSARGRAPRAPTLIYLAVLCALLFALCPLPAHAAVGDRPWVCAAPAAGAVVDTVTSAGVERSVIWIIFESTVDLQIYDGTTVLTFDALTGPGSYNAAPHGFGATSTNRLRIKNTDATAKQICYQYVETKSP